MRVQRFNLTQYEILSWLFTTAFLAFRLQRMLRGETSMCCDTISSEFPVYYFLAEHLLQGVFPFWNPYSHLGEPFYPLLLHTRLLDPNTYLTLFIGHFFTKDLLILFHLHRLLQSFIMSLGIYLVMRPYAKHWRVSVLLIPILLWSSILFASFRQPGVLFHFLWVPYIHLLLRRIFWDSQRPSSAHWALLGILIGLQWQSYWFVATWLYLFVFFIASWLSRKHQPLRWRAGRGPLFLLVFICVMTAPNFAFLLEMQHFVFPMRMVQDFSLLSGGHSSPLASATSVAMGTRANFWNYLSLIFIGRWGEPVETFMYIGLLPWFFSLVGIFFANDLHKSFWLWILGFFTLIHLGSSSSLFPYLHPLLPIFQIIRHPAQLSLFVLFPLLYFFVLGIRQSLATLPHAGRKPVRLSRLSLGLGAAIGVYSGFGLAQLGTHSNVSTTYFPLWLLFFGLTLILLRTHLKKAGIFVSIVTGHFSAILFSINEWVDFVGYCALGLLPLALALIFSRNFVTLRKRSIFLLLILIPLTLELAIYIPKFRGFYESPVTAHELAVPMTPSTPTFPQRRHLNPYPEWVKGNPIVNPSLLLKQAALFATNIPRVLSAARSTWPDNNYYLDAELAKIIYSKAPEQSIQESIELNKPLLEMSSSLSTLRLGSFDDNSLTLYISGPSLSYVVFRDHFHKHWRAHLDGRQIPIEKYGKFFKQILVPPGQHNITFSFFPTPFVVALALFAAANLLGLFLLLSLALRHETLRSPILTTAPSPR